MARLTHTGAQLDAAIRKVRSDFADVSEVNAQPQDVRSGKKIVNALKQEVIGSMPESVVSPGVTLNAETLSETISDYPIEIKPIASIDKAGYVETIPEGVVITKYIKTEAKICTPNETIQEIVPSNGKLLAKVTVRAAADVRPTLKAPTISLSGQNLTITNSSSNGGFVTGYNIYCTFNGVETIVVENTTNTTLNIRSALTNVGLTTPGSYSINVKTKGTNFNGSVASNKVSYTLAPIPSEFLVSLIVEPTDGGYVSGGGKKTVGSQVNISCLAYGSYSFYYWERSGDSTPIYKSSYSFIMPNEDVTFTAYFEDAPCLAKGTLITLADFTYKPIEKITYDDDILCWDFDNGCVASSKPIWLQKKMRTNGYNLLSFDDGSQLRTINQHRIYNCEKNKFTYPMTDNTPIGTTTFNDKGELVTLVSKVIISEEVEYYNIITDYHINAFAGTILTSCRLSNLYRIDNMTYIKDNRKPHYSGIFNELDDKWISGLRLLEQPSDLNRDNAVVYDKSLVDYVKRLERMKKNDK